MVFRVCFSWLEVVNLKFIDTGEDKRGGGSEMEVLVAEQGYVLLGWGKQLFTQILALSKYTNFFL